MVFCLKILFASYLSSRIAAMLVDWMGYGEILGFIKLNIAKKINPQGIERALKETKDLPLSKTIEYFEGSEEEIGIYDYAAKQSFLLRLVNCPFCVSIWVSAIITIIFFNCFWILKFIAIPVISYHLVSKL